MLQVRRVDSCLVIDRTLSYISGSTLTEHVFLLHRDDDVSGPTSLKPERREIDMLRISLFLVSLLTATRLSFAQDEGAKQILAQFDDMRPTANELGMYRLDWAGSLDEALQRAVEERRPVFLIVIHAKYGDVSSGHC